ncbi:MAG: hypothetical protein ACHQQQ_04635 [Bacteroidota bacterium]
MRFTQNGINKRNVIASPPPAIFLTGGGRRLPDCVVRAGNLLTSISVHCDNSSITNQRTKTKIKERIWNYTSVLKDREKRRASQVKTHDAIFLRSPVGTTFL